MTNKELIDKIRNEILHLKMKELQRTNGVNTGADVYLSSYAVLSILSNALTEESEDERIRKALVKQFGGCIKDDEFCHTGFTYAEITAWLEKQKEQKPAWSEEDQLNLNWVIAILNGEPCDLDIQLESLISWLKSLRPSWKPNDNQMSMLRAIVNDPNNVGAESCRLAMQSLYNDLLKLK